MGRDGIKQWLWCERVIEDDEWLEKVSEDEKGEEGPLELSFVVWSFQFWFFTFLFIFIFSFYLSIFFLQIYFEPSHSQVNLNITITITDYRGAQSHRDREGAEQFQLLPLTRSLAHSLTQSQIEESGEALAPGHGGVSIVTLNS